MHSHRRAIRAAVEWLKLAQDKGGDGGVAAWYSLLTRWQPSYIETTGYIISTFLECSKYFHDQELEQRALRMADFLVGMHDESGGYRSQVSTLAEKSPPTVFNCGQDLIGMTDVYKLTQEKKYLESLTKAADFLVSIQEADGSWLKNQYGDKTHVYDTRVAWALLKVFNTYQILGKSRKAARYKLAAIKNLDWALGFQQPNGWFANNELPPPNVQVPYTHTISYALEGLLWSGRILRKRRYISAVIKGTDPLVDYYLRHDNLPGTFNRHWQSTNKYSCLTGDAQLSMVWLVLYEVTNNQRYWQAARRMNRYLKGVQNIHTQNQNIKGAIAGSDPLWGDIWRNRGYCRLAYLNWSTKFFIDALLKEDQLKSRLK